MKKLFLFLAAIALLGSCRTVSDRQTADADIKLQFNEEGTFRIAQFTDMHLCWNRPELLTVALDHMSQMLDSEKPDLVVFTGDIVTGKQADSSWHAVLSRVEERNIPFVVTFGNHDREQDFSAPSLAEIIMSHRGCLNTAYTATLDDKSLEIWGKDGSEVEALIYAFDSNDYSTDRSRGGYGWFTTNQIEDYLKTSRKCTAQNAGVPLPALAFFHIALLEHNEAYNSMLKAGVRGEGECPGDINTGIFGAFHESGDVMGVFVGHDHDNDYTAVRDGIMLGFGLFSGVTEPWGKTTYTHFPGGARMFELKEGERAFTTWKRHYEGEEYDRETFNDWKDCKLRKATETHSLMSGIRMSANGGEPVVVPSPDIWKNLGGNGKYVFDGYLKVPEDGLWTLFVHAYGNSSLTIDDLLIRTDEKAQNRYHEINLEKGMHPVHIEYDSNQSDRIIFRWHPVNYVRFFPIPAENWFCTK